MDKLHKHFLHRISLTGNRYSVELPCKDKDVSILDNHMNSQARMKGQLRRLWV